MFKFRFKKNNMVFIEKWFVPSRNTCTLVFLIFFVVFSQKKVNGEYNCEYKKDGFYMDDEFCHIYWRCNYGVAEEYECSAGTAWNHLENRCDWLDNVDCTRSSSATAATTKTVATKKTAKPKNSDYDEEVETTRKPKKKTEKSTLATTPTVETSVDIPDAFEDELDPETKASAKPAAVYQKSKSSSSSCEPYGVYYVADQSNCASYIICDEGKETKMKCGEKQLFNTETSQCDDFQQVFCANRPINSAERNQCQHKRDGIYADIERACKVFYQCISQNKIREAKCPNNLKFNSLIGRCDNPQKIVAPCGTYALSSASSTEKSCSFRK